MQAPTQTPPDILRTFRPGLVMGGIVAGLLGLVLVAGLVLSLNRKFGRKKAAKGPEIDTLYSPTETSPALRPLREKLSKAELELTEKEAELAVEQSNLPPPFPTYKERSV
ncbi:hypothetical protein TWF594_005185 [Orbilia oligospora]|nr:hypothetical protein TWF103_006486 [Orbilia oligospora]KAF3143116.1 hypothetical protein TWF594_005185 [Orbilia oligospora]